MGQGDSFVMFEDPVNIQPNFLSDRAVQTSGLFLEAIDRIHVSFDNSMLE